MEFNFNDYKCYLKPLSESFIEQNKYHLNWNWISAYQPLSESFIEQNKDLVNWEWICVYQPLSESFIEQNKDSVIWDCISKFQKLSEPFIKQFEDRVKWELISISQKLSEPFIEQHKYRVNLEWISRYQKLSEEFRTKHNLSIPANNWLYTDKETKRQAIEKSGLYEIDNDWVIAYKGIRSNNYSRYNFQYKYELGNTYQSHADHNLDYENSFGLSAWTEEKAREYCDEKIVKVKIHLDHVAALVHNGYKLRCTQFEIIKEL